MVDGNLRHRARLYPPDEWWTEAAVGTRPRAARSTVDGSRGPTPAVRLGDHRGRSSQLGHARYFDWFAGHLRAMEL